MSADTSKKSSKPAVPTGQASSKGVQKKKVQKIDYHSLPIVQKSRRTKPRVFGVTIPKVNLYNYVRWPRYIRVQRQRKVLIARSKVPPVINQFTRTLDKATATTLFRLMNSHKPETPEQKKARLLKAVESKDGQKNATRPITIKHGLDYVTKLVEKKQAKLVVIAHDVSPIELVLWLPTLCKKKDIPYVIVKSKSRLGQVIGRKKACAIAFTDVNPKDKADFTNLVNIAREKYNELYTQTMKTPGGLKMGIKSIQQKAKKSK